MLGPIKRSHAAVGLAPDAQVPHSIGRVRPYVRHPKQAQRTSGLDFRHFDSIERQLPGNHPELPRQAPRLGRWAEVDLAAQASGGSVRM